MTPSSEPTTSVAQSAEIISFPRRFDRASTPHIVATLPDPERLSRALAALLAAQQEQKAALARWQDAIQELRGGVRTLAQSMEDCTKALKTIPPSARPG